MKQNFDLYVAFFLSISLTIIVSSIISWIQSDIDTTMVNDAPNTA